MRPLAKFQAWVWFKKLGSEDAILLLPLLLYTTFIFIFLRHRTTVENLDFWFHLEIGRKQTFSNLQTLVMAFILLATLFY
jgi:hypothetical protein